MDKLEHIYRELGEHICLYPFFGAFYQTNNVIPISQAGKPNSVRPCSIVMADDPTKWDITDQSVIKGRNSTAWRQMREDFLAGRFHDIYDCRSCSYNERVGTTSPRQQNNKFLAQFLDADIVQEVRQIMADDNQVRDVLTLDYYPSNYCNYSCVMCAGGASSQRHTFEVRVLGRKEKIVLNDADPDFYSILDRVQIINFTGGETVLQKQVHEIMDYLIQRDLANNIVITLLTNASSSPEDLDQKFREFKKVIYNVSIDGIGDVGEYQRRGSKWSTVEENSLILMNHRYISTVINFVLTSMNVLNISEFVQWCYDQGFGPRDQRYVENGWINVSPVFRVDHLGVSALPMPLRDLALERLAHQRSRFNIDSVYDEFYRKLVDRFASVINSTPFAAQHLYQFVEHIRREDTVSRRPFVQIVPEWEPYFQS